jgi:hypothetical protein
LAGHMDGAGLRGGCAATGKQGCAPLVSSLVSVVIELRFRMAAQCFSYRAAPEGRVGVAARAAKGPCAASAFSPVRV